MEQEVVLYKAKHPYNPENTDELTLKKGNRFFKAIFKVNFLR